VRGFLQAALFQFLAQVLQSSTDGLAFILEAVSLALIEKAELGFFKTELGLDHGKSLLPAARTGTKYRPLI
jgi:hypothetical protein